MYGTNHDTAQRQTPESEADCFYYVHGGRGCVALYWLIETLETVLSAGRGASIPDIRKVTNSVATFRVTGAQ